MAYTKTCFCGAKIPDGRTYCGACYSEKLAEYRENMEIYKTEMRLWNSLSAEEQGIAHAKAEKQTLQVYAFLGFAGVAVIKGVIGYSMGLWGELMLTVAIIDALVAGGIVAAYLFRTLGRILRAITMGSIASAIILFIVAIVASDTGSDIYIGIVFVVFIICALIEISGGFHADATPKAPVRPSP